MVLGHTGRNFAAGMSGGIAYVLDEDGQFAKRCNLSMVAIEKIAEAKTQIASDEPLHGGQADEELLKSLIEQHQKESGSEKAKALLANWAASRAKFVKVFPNEYRRAMKEMAAKENKQDSNKQDQKEAA